MPSASTIHSVVDRADAPRKLRPRFHSAASGLDASAKRRQTCPTDVEKQAAEWRNGRNAIPAEALCQECIAPHSLDLATPDFLWTQCRLPRLRPTSQAATRLAAHIERRLHMSYELTPKRISGGNGRGGRHHPRPAAGRTFVHAADGRVVVRVEEDLKNLDPAYRTGPIDVNVILAVGQGLVKFKPGTTEWENDAAADIKQVDDKTIEFTLKEGLKFSGGYGDSHRRGREVLVRALHQARSQRRQGRLCRRLGGAGFGRGDRAADRQDPSEEPVAGGLADRARRRLRRHHLEEGVRGARRQVQDHADRLRPVRPEGMGAARSLHAGRSIPTTSARSRPSPRSSASRSPTTRPRSWRCRPARSISRASIRRSPRTSKARPG